jgi:molybdate-binding protein
MSWDLNCSNNNNINRDNEKGARKLIDNAITEDRNMIKIEAEEILKYTDLTANERGTCNILGSHSTVGECSSLMEWYALLNDE